MEGIGFTPPIVVIDEALAAQLLEDGEKVLDGLTQIVEALRAMKPYELRVVVSSSPAASATEPNV